MKVHIEWSNYSSKLATLLSMCKNFVFLFIFALIFAIPGYILIGTAYSNAAPYVIGILSVVGIIAYFLNLFLVDPDKIDDFMIDKLEKKEHRKLDRKINKIYKQIPKEYRKPILNIHTNSLMPYSDEQLYSIIDSQTYIDKQIINEQHILDKIIKNKLTNKPPKHYNYNYNFNYNIKR